MMWPGGHQCCQNGWSPSETSTVLKPRARSPSARNTCSSFSRSMSNASEPFVPLISHWNALRRPCANRVASSVPTEPFANSTAASTASSTLRPGRNVCANPETVAISPLRKRARSTTCVIRSPSAPEPGGVGVEAPRVERRVVAPVLEVAAAEVPHLAELAGLDHLAREPHGRDEAVVERAHVLDARGGDLLPDLVALVGVAAERLLAHDVLARRRRPRSSARRGASSARRCRTARSARRRRGRASRSSRTPSRSGAPPRRPPPRCGRRSRSARGSSGGGHVMYGDLPERVRVRLAHERVAEHPDADRRHCEIVRV